MTGIRDSAPGCVARLLALVALVPLATFAASSIALLAQLPGKSEALKLMSAPTAILVTVGSFVVLDLMARVVGMERAYRAFVVAAPHHSDKGSSWLESGYRGRRRAKPAGGLRPAGRGVMELSGSSSA